MSDPIQLNHREKNTAIRVLIRHGYSNPSIKRFLHVSASRLDENRSQMEDFLGINRPAQVGGIQPSSLTRCPEQHRRYSIALMLYDAIRDTKFCGPLDIVALTKAQRQIEATCLDDSSDWTPCINRFFKVACWFEDDQIRLGPPDDNGIRWISETSLEQT